MKKEKKRKGKETVGEKLAGVFTRGFRTIVHVVHFRTDGFFDKDNRISKVDNEGENYLCNCGLIDRG